MASTSYKTRAIIKEHTNEQTDFAGTYNLLMAAKSMPSPVQPPNTVESTTMEDGQQTFEEGIKTADAREITGNLEKAHLDKIDELSGKKVDIIQLYGTDGVGGVAKYAQTGTVTATPNDVGGNDEILEMTATIIPATVAEKCTDKLKVVDNNDGTFTVTVVG